jgi:hypothetical protein
VTDRNCAIGDKPHTADVGYLCEAHLQKLADTLRQIEDEAQHLDARPSMAIRTGSGGGSLTSERAPVRLDVLAFRDPQTKRWTRDAEPRYTPPPPKSFGPWCLFCDHETCTAWRAGRRRDLHDDEHDAGSDRLMSVLGVLHDWARCVREERDLTPPEHVTVVGERATLTRNLDWLAGQSYVDEFYGDMRELLSGLQSLNGTQPEKPVGRCYLPAEDGECNGPIWLETVAGHAHCGRCGAMWDGAQLARLQWELDQARAEANRPRTVDGRPMQTAAEIARDKGMTVNAVRLRLSKLRVKATFGSYYDADVLIERVS